MTSLSHGQASAWEATESARTSSGSLKFNHEKTGTILLYLKNGTILGHEYIYIYIYIYLFISKNSHDFQISE